MSTRTDIHRPSAPEFDPTDYICQGVYYFGSPEGIGWELAAWHRDAYQAAIAQLESSGITRGGVYGKRQCSHCGAGLSYVALMIHQPSNTYLHIGEDCLQNRFELESAAEFQALRKEMAAGRKAQKKVDRIAELVNDHPLLAELTYMGLMENGFLTDVAFRFRQTGELSDRQIESVERILLRGMEYQARKDAEQAAAKPAPLGRLVVEGVILAIRDHENDFGRVWKMTVRTDDGWKVWVTVPNSLELDDLPNGTRVQFTATLAPGKKDPDPYFVFGTRPTKAKIIT